MDVRGQVVSVNLDVEIPKKAGGTYTGSQLAYRNSANGKLEEQNFTSQTLKYNPSIKTALGNLSTGDNFVMVKEKEGDFWNVKSVTKAGEATVATAEPSSGKSYQPQAKPYTPGGGSTYSTAEERAQTQVYIVRQHSITSAINLLGVGAKAPVAVSKVLETAKEFEKYVFGTNDEFLQKAGEFVDEVAEQENYQD